MGLKTKKRYKKNKRTKQKGGKTKRIQSGGFLPFCLPCLSPLVTGAGVLGTGAAAAAVGSKYYSSSSSTKSSSKIVNGNIERKDEYFMNIYNKTKG